MLLRLRLVGLALVLGLASAQLRPVDAQIMWWASPSCAADVGSTVVVVEQNVRRGGERAR
jgi:hypothetical protein